MEEEKNYKFQVKIFFQGWVLQVARTLAPMDVTTRVVPAGPGLGDVARPGAPRLPTST